jgi:pyridoxal phosphate enzyme (YggS family)
MKPMLKPPTMNPTSKVAVNLLRVRERIAETCLRIGRDPQEVRLIAVSKGTSIKQMQAAYDAGQREFGENYWQEAHDKLPLFPPDTSWHFIGSLQTNKAKYVTGRFALLHVVDRVELMQELQRQASKKELTQSVLIEVKLSNEPTKSGADPHEVPDLVEKVRKQPNLHLQGLMGMAPYAEEKPEAAAPYFAQLRRLFDAMPSENRQWLSMGMTHDYEVALAEGSNMLRIGTAIFGSRD